MPKRIGDIIIILVKETNRSKSSGPIRCPNFRKSCRASDSINNVVNCGVKTNKMRAIKISREEIITIKWLKNWFRESFPSFLNISEKVGMIAAFMEPATSNINNISGIVNAAQKMSNS
jgi:hypothetical protein